MQYISTVVVCFTFCIFFSSAKDCSLYENFDGSRCFWGDELTTALTWSPTLWVIEFYSSWCGHCQHFAPTWKKLATRIKGWSSFVRIGEIDCSQSENGQTCRNYQVMAYPSIKFVPPNTNNPTSSKLQDYIGGRNYDSIIEFILTYLLKNNEFPSLHPLESDSVDSNTVCLIFERRDSYKGMMIILDLLLEKSVHIRRVTDNNTALVKKYSVLHFPSLVLLTSPEKYTILSGKSIDPNDDINDHFIKKIKEFIGSTDHQFSVKTKDSQINEQPHPLFNQYVHVARPTVKDITSAISYSLRMEVRLYRLISDKPFVALLRFLTQLENTFQFFHSSIAHDMRVIRIKLQSKQLAGYILSTEWDRILDSKLNSELFPLEPQWASCSGSLPSYRGYPCGLWSLMHTVTILSLSLPSSVEYRPLNLHISSREAIYTMAEFVKQFFSCEECRKHFSQLAENLRTHPISYDGDSVLWLWEAHNIVNKRLKDESSNDPAHPKVLFPPYQLCPDCYILVVDTSLEPLWDTVGFAIGESMLESDTQSPLYNYHWNKTAVFLFLTNFYGMGYLNEVASSALLTAAWPRKYQIPIDHHYPNKTQTSYTITNSVLFFVQFLACVLLLTFLMSLTLRHKLSWRNTRPLLPTRYKML